MLITNLNEKKKQQIISNWKYPLLKIHNYIISYENKPIVCTGHLFTALSSANK